MELCVSIIITNVNAKMNTIYIYAPAMKWRMAYSFTLYHMYIRRSVCQSVTLYSIVSVSTSAPFQGND